MGFAATLDLMVFRKVDLERLEAPAGKRHQTGPEVVSEQDNTW